MKRRTKSGCRTCRYVIRLLPHWPQSLTSSRIRKVKCDEERPACTKCVSTGRKCDGYGILSGTNIEPLSCRSPAITRHYQDPVPPLISLLKSTYAEREHLDWFQHRASIKLPGFFASGFWSSLLLQASYGEPSILHAVVALSSVHKSQVLAEEGTTALDGNTNCAEQRTLHHYLQAIKYLQPYLKSGTQRSLRVALIVSIVLASSDLLRGHFSSAKLHVQSGKKILREFVNESSFQSAYHSDYKATDSMISAAFSRLQYQIELFDFWGTGCDSYQNVGVPRNHGAKFPTFDSAWSALEHLVNKVASLAREAGTVDRSYESTSAEGFRLQVCQRSYRSEIDDWLYAYKSSANTLRGVYCCGDRVIYQLLQIYHSMLSIMVNICLNAQSETVYDSQNAEFQLVLAQLIEMFQRCWGSSHLLRQRRSVHSFVMSHSIIDMGSIPVLYHIATKCRVHRIRLQATRLLESSPHREGFWDARLMGCVARKVMEIEEQDFFKNLPAKDDFDLFDLPEEDDFALPPLPETNRLRGIDVVLSGSPLDAVFLYCSRKTPDGGESRVLLGQYDVQLERWMGATSSIIL